MNKNMHSKIVAVIITIRSIAAVPNKAVGFSRTQDGTSGITASAPLTICVNK
jgi:hypothetical protein